jgi:hypothetical protein
MPATWSDGSHVNNDGDQGDQGDALTLALILAAFILLMLLLSAILPNPLGALP